MLPGFGSESDQGRQGAEAQQDAQPLEALCAGWRTGEGSEINCKTTCGSSIVVVARKALDLMKLARANQLPISHIMSGEPLHIASYESTPLAACRPPLLPSFSAALQHFPPTAPALRTRIGSHACFTDAVARFEAA